MSRPIRLTAVLTHPIQYYSPWFRFIAANCQEELSLNVIYLAEPDAAQQGVGFGSPFQWDVPLRSGYENCVIASGSSKHRFDAESFWGINEPGLTHAILGTKPEVVLMAGWHSVTLLRGVLGCRRNRVPVLYRGDTNLVGRGSGLEDRLWRARSRFLLKLFERYLAVGTRAREYLSCLGVPEERIFDSPHAVDNDFFARSAAPYHEQEARCRAREAWQLPSDSFVVLFVGKFEAKKRPLDVLRAVALLDGTVSVLAVGSGPLESECKAESERLGVAVSWRGFLNQGELGRAYGVSDCLVLPSSHNETWGLVVNEAMATGLPCVVSDRVGCAPDLIEPGRTGELYPAGDVVELASALLRVREDKAAGVSRSRWCRERLSYYGYGKATEGVVDACRSLQRGA